MIQHNVSWTLAFQAWFSGDKSSSYRKTLNSLLKKRGFTKDKSSEPMTFRKSKLTTDEAMQVLQGVFEAYKPRQVQISKKTNVLKIRKLTVQAEPHYD
jgi:hypothetical protein